MSRSTQHVLLLLVGLATGVMVVKGTYLNYVKPTLLPWLVIAAGVLVVLGVSGVLEDLRHLGERGEHGEHGHAHPHPHGHAHAHHTGLAWLLLVPIALLAFVVPPPLDARGTTPTAAAKEPELRAFPPLPPGPEPEVSVPEAVMRAAADSAHSLDDRTISLTGFVVNRPGGGVDLGRVVIVCCAADAQLARVHLDGGAAAGYPEDTWVRVRGRMRPGSSDADDGFVPTLAVTDVTRVDKPKNAYAY